VIIQGEVERMLRQNICVVEFRKVTNDAMRAMICTLRPDIIPPTKGMPHPLPPGLVPVWCLDKADWRSFYINTVRNVRVMELRGLPARRI
jgi:hypothetical protein